MKGTDREIATEWVPVCALCGQGGVPEHSDVRDRVFGTPGAWDFLRCPGCRLIWLNPRPVPSDSHVAYGRYYTHQAAQGRPLLDALRRRVVDSVVRVEFGYRAEPHRSGEALLGRCARLFSPAREAAGRSVMWLDSTAKAALLDVGCGSGRYLRTMAELGWCVTGVEPDPEAAAVARDVSGAAVHVSDLAGAALPDNTFDAVTMNHVIEHVHDPLAVLRESCRVLKPGGRLVVVTPNSESLGHRLFGRSWRGLEPPRHLHVFSCDTLRLALQGTGLEVLQLRTIAGMARAIWYWSSHHGGYGQVPVRALRWWPRLQGLVFQVFEQAALSLSSGLGEEVLLIACKASR